MARTRAVDYDAKQRHILDAAAHVFGNYGMEKASIAEVARRADVSKSLLYHYYESKDALIFDIVRTHLEELERNLTAAAASAAAPEDRFRALIHTVMRTYKDADDKHKVQLSCKDALSATQVEALKRIERRIVRHFKQVVSQLNPQLADGHPLLTPVTMSLFGILNWTYMWFSPDGPNSREEYADMIATLMLGGVGALA